MDADCKKSAMKVLKSYVKEMDSKAIPLFLAQVSETNESGFTGEYTISLYEVLARVHGTKIVSQIDNIMSTVIKTLSSSAGSFALHQACSKVVPAIARYGMDPRTPEDKKRYIVHSLSKPLSDCLLGSHESISSGAALCLKALVECDNWSFASSEMVNEVCQRVVGALEKYMQYSHMTLVMALAKRNSSIVEAYARLLIHTAVDILNTGVVERNSQKRLSAIHMINTIMKCLDPKSIFSEVWLIVNEMEKFQADQVAYVSGAAFDALQTAISMRSEKSSEVERDTGSGSVTCSNYSRGEHIKRRNIKGTGDWSPLSAMPESRNIDSFCGFDYLIDSPVSIYSINQSSQGLGYERRSVNHKLWASHENGGVDVSVEDGALSEVVHASAPRKNESDGFSSGHEDCTYDFKGFSQGSDAIGNLRSATPSPQKSWKIDNVKIFTTPRKLMQSLQELNDSTCDNKGMRKHSSSTSRKLEYSPIFQHAKTCHCYGLSRKECDDERSSTDDEQFQSSKESVYSTEDIPNCINQEIIAEAKFACVTKPRIISIQVGRWNTRGLILGTLMILFAVLVFLFCVGDQQVHYNMVPT